MALSRFVVYQLLNPFVLVLNAGIRISSQQSEHEDDNYALYTTPALHGLSNPDRP
jgi:hypothetical protein